MPLEEKSNEEFKVEFKESEPLASSKDQKEYLKKQSEARRQGLKEFTDTKKNVFTEVVKQSRKGVENIKEAYASGKNLSKRDETIKLDTLVVDKKELFSYEEAKEDARSSDDTGIGKIREDDKLTVKSSGEEEKLP